MEGSVSSIIYFNGMLLCNVSFVSTYFILSYLNLTAFGMTFNNFIMF